MNFCCRHAAVVVGVQILAIVVETVTWLLRLIHNFWQSVVMVDSQLLEFVVDLNIFVSDIVVADMVADVVTIQIVFSVKNTCSWDYCVTRGAYLWLAMGWTKTRWPSPNNQVFTENCNFLVRDAWGIFDRAVKITTSPRNSKSLEKTCVVTGDLAQPFQPLFLESPLIFSLFFFFLSSFQLREGPRWLDAIASIFRSSCRRDLSTDIKHPCASGDCFLSYTLFIFFFFFFLSTRFLPTS